MLNKFVIGVSGRALAGKNTFARFLTQKFKDQYIPVKELAFATRLKSEMQPYLVHTYGIDIFDCTPTEKEICRPSIIKFAKERREATAGQHWWKLLQSDLDTALEQVIVITDARFAFYPNDEHYFIKEICHGMLIHLRKYDEVDGERVYHDKTNEEEDFNDPLIKAASNIKYEWPTTSYEEILKDNKNNLIFNTILTKYINGQ